MSMPNQKLVSLYKPLDQFTLPSFAFPGLISGGLVNITFTGNQTTKPAHNKLLKVSLKPINKVFTF